MKFTLVFCGIVSAVLVSAAPDLRGYKVLDAAGTAGRNVLRNPAFDEGSEGKEWSLGKEAEISAAYGRNQRGLGLRRTDPGVYSINTQKLRLKPNTKYIAGVWIRNEGFDPALKDCWLGTFGIEWYQGKRNLISSYVKSTGNADWKLYTLEFTTGKDPALEYVMVLFIGKGRTGTASFDDAFVREAGPQWLPAVLSPHTLHLDASGARMEIGSVILGEFSYPQTAKPHMECVAVLRGEDSGFRTERSGLLRENRIAFDFGNIPEGNYSLELILADTVNKVILATRTGLRFQALSPGTQAARKVQIDVFGRMLVNGKPFLPVGLFVGGVNEEDVRNWSHSPFNFVMPYGGAALKWPGEFEKDRDSENLLRALDKLQAAGIRFGCNLLTSYPHFTHPGKSRWDGREIGIDPRVDKIVDVIKNHSATLFYYICDELPASRSREIEERRIQLSRRDPDHPALAVYFQYPDLAFYSNAQDIAGLIFYPVAGRDSRSMELILHNMEAAKTVLEKSNGTMSLWAVGQAFNWGCYEKDRKRYETLYRYPTEHEYIAMALLPAIYGVRGWLFYSYHELRYVPGSMDETEKKIEFCREWPKVCAMGKVLRELEPFLLSLQKAPEVGVETVRGKVKARAFADDSGKQLRVLVTGIGPGASEAVLAVPGSPGLKSRFGKTENLGGGKYRFKGTDICCDILYGKVE